jgi:hypothetical protein
VASLDRWLPVWNSTEYGRRLSAQRRSDLVQIVAWSGGRPAARSLHAKLGYVTAHGPFISGAVLAGNDGSIPVAGILDYLVKTIA